MASEKSMPEEEMRLRLMMDGFLLSGLQIDSVDFRLRLSALTRILAYQKEHRIIRMLSTPIRNGWFILSQNYVFISLHSS